MTETDLTEITRHFGATYKLSKDWDKLKAGAQKEFFAAATQELEQTRLPQKIVEGDLSRIEVHYPGWRVISNDDDQVTLEQDPSLMDFVFINPEDGMVYRRSVTHQAEMLDDERLRAEDPELWKEISEWNPAQKKMIDCAADYFGSSSFFSLVSLDRLYNYVGMERIPKSTSEWTTEQAERLRPYLVPGTVSVKLTAPRQATEEELESSK